MLKIIAEVTYEEVVKQALNTDCGFYELLCAIINTVRETNTPDDSDDIYKDMTDFSNELSSLMNKYRNEKHLF